VSLCAGTLASIAVFTRRSEPRMSTVVGAPPPAGVRSDDLIRPPFANRSATEPTASNAAVEIATIVSSAISAPPARNRRSDLPMERPDASSLAGITSGISSSRPVVLSAA